jgi:hypothetical protein
MKVQVFQLMYKLTDGTPGDPELFAMAEKYAAENLAMPVDLRTFRPVFVACEVSDSTGKPVRVLGVLCMVQRTDVPVMRFTDTAAVVKLVQRANDYLHDQGLRGHPVFIEINDEKPEQMCPKRDEWMQVYKLKPAKRYQFVVE